MYGDSTASARLVHIKPAPKTAHWVTRRFMIGTPLRGANADRLVAPLPAAGRPAQFDQRVKACKNGETTAGIQPAAIVRWSPFRECYRMRLQAGVRALL